jgi:hypothetical protein
MCRAEGLSGRSQRCLPEVKGRALLGTDRTLHSENSTSRIEQEPLCFFLLPVRTSLLLAVFLERCSADFFPEAWQKMDGN